jgi:indole-3-glycerol phosphate synthase
MGQFSVGRAPKGGDKRRSPIHRGGVKQMEYIKNAEDLAHVFSVATGPSFFLGAVAALLSVVLNRLNSVLARLDELTISDEIVVAGSKRDKSVQTC